MTEWVAGTAGRQVHVRKIDRYMYPTLQYSRLPNSDLFPFYPTSESIKQLQMS